MQKAVLSQAQYFQALSDREQYCLDSHYRTLGDW